MNIVVDTNMVFSALISPTGAVSDLLMNAGEKVQFFSPKFLEIELSKYENKMLKYSGLEQAELLELKQIVLRKLEMIDHRLIGTATWIRAKKLTNGIDPKDAPFVALAIELKSLLWTGDKKLINGLKQQDINWAIDTQALQQLIV